MTGQTRTRLAGQCSKEFLTTEDDVGIPPELFICLFFAGLGIFFMGVGVLWWVSLQARELKRRSGG